MKPVFIGAALLLAVLTAGAVAVAEGLLLEGEAVRDKFVKINSDKPGKWTVFHVDKEGMIDIVDIIILQDGKQCVFVGPPGRYLVMCNVPDEPMIRVKKVEIGKVEPTTIKPLQTTKKDDRTPPAAPEPDGSNPNTPGSEEPDGAEAVDTSQYHPLALEIINQTNAFRQRYGLNPLSIDPVLMESAQAWTGIMASTGRFNHSPSGRYRPGASENIAMGNSDPLRTMQQWINSGGHRANMLGSHGVIGVGVANGPRGWYWTQQFRGDGQGYSGGYSSGGSSRRGLRGRLFRRRR